MLGRLLGLLGEGVKNQNFVLQPGQVENPIGTASENSWIAAKAFG